MKYLALVVLSLTLTGSANQCVAQDYYHLSITGSKSPFVRGLPLTNNLLISTDRSNASDEKNDVMSATVSLPFAVNFYGSDYTSYRVSDNGYLTFDVSQTTSNPNNTSLPNASAPKNAIFAMWDDLELEQYGTYLFAVLNATEGTAPNRTHMVKWFQANHVDRPVELSELYYFSIVFHEQGGFDIIHEGRHKEPDGQEVTESGTIGIANSDGTKGYTVEGPNFPFPTTSSQTMTDDIVYSFFPGPQHSNDIQLTKFEAPVDVALGRGAVDFEIEFRNIAKDTLSNFNLNYLINGDSLITDYYNTEIEPGSFSTQTIGSKWTPTSAGVYEIKVFSSHPNGSTDPSPFNDTIARTITVHETTFDRKPLYELFNASTCGPSKTANNNFRTALNGRYNEFTYLCYQADFPGSGDPYSTAETVNRQSFYSFNKVPRLMVNGVLGFNPYFINSDEFHNNAINEFSLFSIDANVNKWGQSVAATIEVLSMVNRNDVSLYAAIVETTTIKNAKENGETEFHNVHKKFLTPENGYTYNAKYGEKQTLNLQFDFKGEYRLPSGGRESEWINDSVEHSVEHFDSLIVVVWLQDNQTKQVYQSTYASEIKLSVPRVVTPLKVDAYPNPTNGVATISMLIDQLSNVELSIYNAMGQNVDHYISSPTSIGLHTLEVDLKGREPGVYNVVLNTQSGQAKCRIVLVE